LLYNIFNENFICKEPITKETTMAKKTDKSNSALEAVLTQIRKQYGDGAIMRMGDVQTVQTVPTISTGAFSLDIALGVGGLPRGRIVEIFGPESSGKTTLALHVIARAQKEKGTAAFIDAEHALDPTYAARIGVKLDELLVSQPTSGEEALTIAETLVKSNSVDVVVIDSVAALVPKAELDGEMGDSHLGLQARLMSQAMRKLSGVVSTSGTLCIFTNQIRQKIGVIFGNPETTPGGLALKFYASIRLHIQRVASIKDSSGAVIGNRTRVKVVKNKLAPPFGEAEFDIYYAKGISWEGSVLDAAIKYEVVGKRGAWLIFKDEQLGQGLIAARERLEQDPALVERIIAEVKQKAAGNPLASAGIENEKEE
jgi:recombination protein RecA